MTRPAGPPAVVIDTNLVLSAFVFAHGRLAALRAVWQVAEAAAVPRCERSDAIELAVAGEAAFLVTADKDLLAMPSGLGRPIVTAEDFLMRIDQVQSLG